MPTNDSFSKQRPQPARGNTTRLGWLVIPGPADEFPFLSLDRLKRILQHSADYDVKAILIHGVNICDFIYLDKYGEYNRLTGRDAQRMRIKGNLEYLNAAVSTIEGAGLEAILSCAMVSLPGSSLKGCHDYVNPFLSTYPQTLDADGDFFWGMIDGQVTELFKNVPDLGGLDIYLSESNFQVNSLNGSLTYEDTLAKLFLRISQACDRAEKDFSIMCFAHTAYENDVMRTALQRLSETTNLLVRHFTNSCDFHPSMPANDNIGKVGSHHEGLEFDCIGEYWGQGRIPACNPQYLQERLIHARHTAPDFCDVVCRVNWEWGDIFDTPNEAGVYVVNELLKTPDRPAQELLQMWAARTYGERSAVAVADALSPTFEAAAKLFYLQGFWVSDHSEVPDLEYAYDHLLGYGIEHICRLPERQPAFLELMHPKETTVEMVLEEKDQAADICRQGLQKLDSVRAHLAPAAYAELRRCFELELNCISIWRLFAESMVRRQMYYDGDSTQLRLIEARLKDLALVAHETEQKYGSHVHPGNPDAIRTFVRSLASDLRLAVSANSCGKDV